MNDPFRFKKCMTHMYNVHNTQIKYIYIYRVYCVTAGPGSLGSLPPCSDRSRGANPGRLLDLTTSYRLSALRQQKKQVIDMLLRL